MDYGKLKILTPENIEIEYTKAGLFPRAAASFIDMFILYLISLLFLHAKLYYLKNEFYNALAVIILADFFLYLLYGIFFEALWGKTPGKKIMHLKVIQKNGTKLTLNAAIIRNLFKFIFEVYGIGVILMLFFKSGLRLGDMAAGTVVVFEEEKEMPKTLKELCPEITPEIRSCFDETDVRILREFLSRREQLQYSQKLCRDLKTHFETKLKIAGYYESSRKFLEIFN